jgi:hypothetical protein
MAEAESDDDQRTENESNDGMKKIEEEIIKTRNVTFYLSFCMIDTSNLFIISSINICCQDERLGAKWPFKI